MKSRFDLQISNVALAAIVAMALAGCSAPQPPQPFASPTPEVVPTVASTPAPPTPEVVPTAISTPASPVATWTPVPTLEPQAYLDAMREAASAMRLAAKILDHTDTVLTRHITSTVSSREVTSLAGSDGRILRFTRISLRGYQDRGLFTPALSDAVDALELADNAFSYIETGNVDNSQALGMIQDAEFQLAAALYNFREELGAQGLTEAQINELLH